MQRIFATVVMVGMLSAGVSYGGNADYTLTPLGGTQWELSVVVSGGDTSGLSAFNIDITGTNAEVSATTFNFEPRIKGLNADAGFAPSGFQTQLAGLIGEPATATLYNAAGSQPLDAGALFDVGINVIDIPNATIPNNDIFFGVPAVLGVVDSPIDFIANPSGIGVDAGLYDDQRDPQGFLPTSDVSLTIIPEPASMALLGLGSLCFFRRR